ncbi:MAG: extracellular solute-binding protein [Candidatus Latescibacterota bacterium]|nr:extracellular solute-binding protein [Candidatus Latescibacterota bacterium]
MTATALGLLLVALILSSCGEGARETGGARPVQDLEAVDPYGQEVVFWYQHTREREEALAEMIQEFNASNEHEIRVHGEFAGRYGDIYNKMMVGLQGGELPTLVVAYQNQARVYNTADGVVDLSPYMVSAKWGLSAQERADFFDTFIAQDRHGDKQLGFPPNRSIEILYYNQDWLKELGFDGPPASWEDFAIMCRAAKETPFTGNDDPSRSLGFVLDEDASRLATQVFSRGGSFMGADHSTYTLDTDAVQQSLTLMRDLAAEGAVELMGEPYGDQTEFVGGRSLFVLRSSSGLLFVQAAIDEGIGFSWNVAPPPHSTVKPVVNFYGASVSMCPSTPEEQLAAWLFLKWFTEPAQQARWVRASNYFPVRKSAAAQLDDYFAENPRYQQVFKLLGYGKAEPSAVGYEAVRRLISQAVVKALQSGEITVITGELERQANASRDEL